MIFYLGLSFPIKIIKKKNIFLIFNQGYYQKKISFLSFSQSFFNAATRGLEFEKWMPIKKSFQIYQHTMSPYYNFPSKHIQEQSLTFESQLSKSIVSDSQKSWGGEVKLWQSLKHKIKLVSCKDRSVEKLRLLAVGKWSRWYFGDCGN